MIETVPAAAADMRIRSEPFEAGPRRFDPAPAQHEAPPPDRQQFARLASALGELLGELAGQPVKTVVLGWACPGWANATPRRTQVASSLGVSLASIRFGGAPETGSAVGGIAARRMTERLVAAIDALVGRRWPDDVTVAGIEVDASLAETVHALWLAAPAPEVKPSAPSLAAALLDQPFRLPVAISSELVEVGQLLPFVAGVVWPITPRAQVPLATGGQRIAVVRIEPAADGRQQAVVTGGLAERGGTPA